MKGNKLKVSRGRDPETLAHRASPTGGLWPRGWAQPSGHQDAREKPRRALRLALGLTGPTPQAESGFRNRGQDGIWGSPVDGDSSFSCPDALPTDACPWRGGHKHSPHNREIPSDPPAVLTTE